METELLKVYDANNEYLGYDLPRFEVHQQGLWHRALHCWVIFQENEKNYILLQQRSSSKTHHPNKLDASVGGHYTSNDTENERFREIEEELGLKVIEKDLIFKGVRTCIAYLENGIINREFQDTYFFVYHQPITNYKVQFAEIQALLPLEIEQGMALFSQETDKIEAVLYKIVGNQMNYTYQPQKIWITKNDFVQSTDNYFYTSMQLAKEILKNKSLSV